MPSHICECGFPINAFAFANATHVYAAASNGIYRSDNLGASWFGTNGPGDMISLLPDKSDANALFLGRSNGLWYSSDGGATIAPVPNGPALTGSTVLRVTAIVSGNGPQPDPRLWAATENAGIFASNDSGASWSLSNKGLRATSIRAVAIHPTAQQQLYAGYASTLTADYALPLHTSSDGGHSWTAATALAGDARLIRSIAIDPTTAGTVPTTHVYAVGRFGPGNDRNGGIYKSTDGGQSWNVIDAGLPCCSYGANFIGTVRTVVLDPRSCDSPPLSGPCTSGPLKTLYVTASGYLERGAEIAKSTDGGASWSDASQGLPPAIDSDVFEVVTPLSLVIDPADNQVLYVGTFDTNDTSGVSGPPPPPSLPSGVFRSDDGGAHWYQQSNGLPRKEGSSVTSLDVMALVGHPQNSGVLWAAVTEADVVVPSWPSRIFKSVDGGANWSESSTGLQNDCDVRAMKIDPTNPDILYTGGFLLHGGQGCLYRSTDGGASWLPQAAPPANAILAIDIDPQDHTRLAVGTNAGVYEWVDVPDPIFESGFELN
jgi:photosystem II stability/assembly factor-like uncharacterized protein